MAVASEGTPAPLPKRELPDGLVMRWMPERKKPGEIGTSRAAPSSSATRSRAWLTPWRLAPLLLWGLVVLAAGGGLVAQSRGGGGAPSTALGQAAMSAAGPQGWAQLYLKAFLTAGQSDQAQLEAYFPDAPTLLGVQADSMSAAWTVSMGARQSGPNYWTVIVAAALQGKRAGHWQALGTRYYSVAVAEAAGHYSTTQLPSEIPAPPTAMSPALSVAQPAGVVAPSPVSATVSQFLQALLAGQGVISRYETPALGVPALTPTPFVTVQLVGLSGATSTPARGSPPTYSALAQVRATDAAGRVQMMNYALGLVLVDQQWEVDKFGGAPALAPSLKP